MSIAARRMKAHSTDDRRASRHANDFDCQPAPPPVVSGDRRRRPAHAAGAEPRAPRRGAWPGTSQAALEGDEHAIHQARVATRRLREIVPIVIDIRAGRGARLRRRLKRLTAALGPVRELDVALGAAGQPCRGRAGDAGRWRCGTIWRRGGAWPSSTCARPSIPGRARRLLARLADLVEDLDLASRRGHGGLPTRERRRLARGVIDRARDLGIAVAEAGAILIVDRVHAVRIATKRLRYALELTGRAAAGADGVAGVQPARDAGRAGAAARSRRAAGEAAQRAHRVAAGLHRGRRSRTAVGRLRLADIRLLHARYLARRACAGSPHRPCPRPDCPMPGPFHLYLVRHAVAEERGADWPDDSQRPLTAEGSKRWRREAHGLVALGARPDLILTSPFTRARQTADLLAAAFPKKPKVVELPALQPGMKPRDVLRALQPEGRIASLALVGHEPGPRRAGGFAGGVQDAARVQEGRRRADRRRHPAAAGRIGAALLVADAEDPARVVVVPLVPGRPRRPQADPASRPPWSMPVPTLVPAGTTPPFGTTMMPSRIT